MGCCEHEIRKAGELLGTVLSASVIPPVACWFSSSQSIFFLPPSLKGQGVITVSHVYNKHLVK